jgi:hypothetical protein
VRARQLSLTSPPAERLDLEGLSIKKGPTRDSNGPPAAAGEGEQSPASKASGAGVVLPDAEEFIGGRHW